MFGNRDITYCTHKECKLTNCMRHWDNAPKGGYLSICQFDCPAVALEKPKKRVKNSVYGEVKELVRCKDCKHWLKDVAGCTDFVGRCELGGYMVGETGYCVYGERKDNDEE